MSLTQSFIQGNLLIEDGQTTQVVLPSYSPPSPDLNPLVLWREGHGGEVTG